MAKPDWVTLSQSAGTWGLRTISVTVAPNTIYSARTATLTVQTLGANLTENIIINQSAKAATGSMTFNPTGLSYTYEGGILYLHFTANDNWTCTSWPTWVGISGNDGISGSAGTYTWGVTALQNSSINDLNSQFTFTCGGNTFTVPVHQDAYQEQTGTTGTISVSPTSITNIASGGSAYTITITSNTGWTITDKPDWVTVSTTGGTGNGAIIVTVSNNSSGARTGNITFTTTDNAANASVSLSQNAYVAPSTLSVSPTSITGISENGSAYTITITSNTDWVVTGYPSWVTLSATAGTGNGSITATVSSNNDYGRSGSIVFKTTDNAVSASVVLSQESGQVMPTGYTQYLTFEVVSGNSGDFRYCGPNDGGTSAGPIEYSINNGEWLSGSATEFQDNVVLANVSAGDIIRIRGNNDCYPMATIRIEKAYYNIYGNIMSLIYGDNYQNQYELPQNVNYGYGETFKNLFFGGLVIDASNLVLPATTLEKNCYQYMFRGCSYLTNSPTTLPATVLKQGCYQTMFSGCTSLTIAPELPSTTLVTNCYAQMFDGCTNLSYIKCLATDISASNCTYRWLRNVSSTGTFVKASSMTGWFTGGSGIPSNWTVQDA